jgi:hypothetical protein
MQSSIDVSRINEETFWCNYFYRVSLIKQSTQLSALAHENGEHRITRALNSNESIDIFLLVSCIFSSASTISTDDTRSSMKGRSKSLVDIELCHVLTRRMLIDVYSY